MSNNGIVNIHGKEYMTVARRIEIAHEEKALESVETEVLNHDPVVIRAKVILKGKVYSGISSVSLESPRLIEKQNPYEVAETSAVGRALGFAGYGLIESVASADEMVRAQSPATNGAAKSNGSAAIAVKGGKATTKAAQTIACGVCGKPAIEKKGISQAGKSYHAVFCSTEDKSHTQWL
jgi:hypothetical protein